MDMYLLLHRYIETLSSERRLAVSSFNSQFYEKKYCSNANP